MISTTIATYFFFIALVCMSVLFVGIDNGIEKFQEYMYNNFGKTINNFNSLSTKGKYAVIILPIYLIFVFYKIYHDIKVCRIFNEFYREDDLYTIFYVDIFKYLIVGGTIVFIIEIILLLMTDGGEFIANLFKMKCPDDQKRQGLACYEDFNVTDGRCSRNSEKCSFTALGIYAPNCPNRLDGFKVTNTGVQCWITRGAGKTRGCGRCHGGESRDDAKHNPCGLCYQRTSNGPHDPWRCGGVSCYMDRTPKMAKWKGVPKIQSLLTVLTLGMF